MNGIESLALWGLFASAYISWEIACPLKIGVGVCFRVYRLHNDFLPGVLELFLSEHWAMSLQTKQDHYSSIQSITSYISVSQRMIPSLDEFTKKLLSSIKWTDFNQFHGEMFSTLVAQSFELMQKRKPGECKLKVYSPEVSDHYQFEYGDFTVIDIANDDIPFLLDSVLGELQSRNMKIHLVLHPNLSVRRDSKGNLKEVLDNTKLDGLNKKTGQIYSESFVSLHIDPLSEKAMEELETALKTLVKRVQLVVNDWLLMRTKLTTVATGLSTNQTKVPVSQLSESIQFLRWANDNNFTFLGMREYKLKGKGKTSQLTAVEDSGLGLLRDDKVEVLRKGKTLCTMTPEVRKFFFSPSPIIITKANIKSDVHRRTYMDYIGVKLFDEKGNISGELRIVGLFTSTAYASKVASIPLLRQKLDHVLDHSGSPRDSHSGKALTNIVETFPRDELFQISKEMLSIYATEIETLDHSPRVKVLKRVDEFDRFVSLMVFLPKDQFSTDIRKYVGDYLAKSFKGRVSAYYPYFAEGPYVRIHYIIGRDEGKTPKRVSKSLEKDIQEISRRWEDRMQDEISKVHDVSETELLLEQYGQAFPVGYQEVYKTDRLMSDIHIIEEMDENRPTAVSFYRSEGTEKDCVEVTLYNLSASIPLSKRVPIFENLGFSVIDERSYVITPDKGEGQPTVCQHMMKLKVRNGEAIDLSKLEEKLVKGFMSVWRGDAADDGYNQMISLLGIHWREAALLRGLGSYLRQINVPYDQDYLVQTLVHYKSVTKDMVELFNLRFDPSKQKGASAKIKRINKKIDQVLSDIPSLDEDQILRHFRNLIMVALRTNYFQRDENGLAPEELVFKFDSQTIDGVPEPKPYREIFVYSPKVEGVHLRFGKIARGGLRWSDRHQDFRTEVLGLVKAQLVKNTVIVPTGSKGGFVPKDMPSNPSREEFMAHGIAAYKRFINGMLSITDNMVGKKIVAPENTVRHDDDDPYLVVAADKGTATFSDIANEISCSRGFWLGDAFASGGSQGYDHKVMGITARGGWEAVKRHFREMNINIQRQPFTAIGVGDMSGDVFGNGMLLSKATKLLAAFDHRDIFIDPNPDPKSSWKERKRLFDAGRSSWQDYNKKLISKGGGIFSRSAKSIKLSSEIKEMLGVSDNEMTPTKLMKTILKSNADLLWFGGIGTYVRGSSQSDSAVGDRGNDVLRVSAQELNVKVIGEGANLGITQEGRMEFAALGGRVNTDAIDNSAGVNSSDLEVNIKIALGAAVASNRISTDKRNKILSSMTEQVAKRCLVNNYQQTLTLSLAERRGITEIGFQQRLMRVLEEKGLMNREIENLPEDAVLAERKEAGDALTRPELSTLLGFAKIDLFNDLIDSDVVDDPYFAASLKDYFPDGMQKDFASEIRNHPLRREIVATQLTNNIINRGGSTMAVRLEEETGHSRGELAAAFTVATAVLGLDDIYSSLDALDNKLDGALQLKIYSRLQFISRRKTAWFITNGDFSKGLSKEIKVYQSGLNSYMKKVQLSQTDEQKAQISSDMKELVDGGLPEKVALSIVNLMRKNEGLDVVKAARNSDLDVSGLTQIHNIIDDQLRLGALIRATDHVPVSDVYDRWALNAVVSRIQGARRSLMVAIGHETNGFDAWMDHKGLAVTRVKGAIDEIINGGEIGLSKLIVAVGQIDELSH